MITITMVVHCDMCPEVLRVHASTQTAARKYARDNGWRRDKIGRDVCSGHPKLKGSR